MILLYVAEADWPDWGAINLVTATPLVYNYHRENGRRYTQKRGNDTPRKAVLKKGLGLGKRENNYLNDDREKDYLSTR